MAEEKIRGFVTKYALTKGIIEMVGIYNTEKGYVWGKISELGFNDMFYVGKDFFKNLDDAKENAEFRKNKDIISQENILSKLKSYTP